MNDHLCYASNPPYDTLHPILLPKDHPVSQLIILDTHQRIGHSAIVEHVLIELQLYMYGPVSGSLKEDA